MKIRPPEIAGDASWRAFSRLRARHARRRSCGQHDRLAILAQHVDLSVGGNRRGREDTAGSLLPHALAGARVDGAQHADVARHVEQPVVVHERRHVGRAGIGTPHHVALADIAFASRSNRHVRTAAIAAARVDRAFVEDGHGNRKAIRFPGCATSSSPVAALCPLTPSLELTIELMCAA